MISIAFSSGFSTLLLKASNLSFQLFNCVVACSIVSFCLLTIASFHFKSIPSSSGFSRSKTSSGGKGLTGNLLIKLWLAATNKSTAKGSNTQIIIRIIHLTASEVFTSLVTPQSTASAAMYLTGPTSASNLIIFDSNGSLSTTRSSIVFCADNMFASASFI